jgi:hypothetical protein
LCFGKFKVKDLTEGKKEEGKKAEEEGFQHGESKK